MELRTYIEEILLGGLSHANIASLILPHIQNLNPDPLIETVDPAYIATLGKLIGVINTGLGDIYKLLPLAEEELVLVTNPSTDRYRLTKEHAFYAGAYSAAPKWIDDSEYAPFPDNVIECLQVIDECGVGLATNNTMANGGVYFPTPNTIQVPFAEYEVTLNVLYRASHKKIEFSSARKLVLPSGGRGFINSEELLRLPSFLTNALTCFILSKYYKAIGSVDSIAQSQANYQEYMAAIDAVKNGQLLHGNFTEINNLANNGWV